MTIPGGPESASPQAGRPVRAHASRRTAGKREAWARGAEPVGRIQSVPGGWGRDGPIPLWPAVWPGHPGCAPHGQGLGARLARPASMNDRLASKISSSATAGSVPGRCRARGTAGVVHRPGEPPPTRL